MSCLLAGVTGTLADALLDPDLVVRQQASQCMVHIAASQKGCADMCERGVILKLVAMVRSNKRNSPLDGALVQQQKYLCQRAGAERGGPP